VDGNVQAVLSMQDVSSMAMTETDKDYIVEGKVALAEVFSALKNYMGGFDEMEDLGFDLGSMDLKNVDPAKVTYHFDKNTQEPTGVDIDMADCMNSLMQQLIKQAAGLGQQVGGDSGLNIDLSAFIKMEAEKFNISIKDIVFDKNIKIELPEAAKNAAEAPVIGPTGVPSGYEEFEVDEMRLYLPSGFSEEQAEGYTKAFTDGANVVLVLKEEKSLFGNYASNMEEYIQLVAEANKSRGITEVQYENGRPTFEYEYAANGNTYKYYTSLYESDEAYWIVQFASLKQYYDKLRASFVNMADIVSFDE
jgi:hypothetical protein